MDSSLAVTSAGLLHFVELMLMFNALYLPAAGICDFLRNILHTHLVVSYGHKHMKGNKWESLEWELELR